MRIDFPELGEGQFVETKNLMAYKWKKQKAIASKTISDDISSQMNAAETLALDLIKGGYLLDEDDKPIQFPLTAETVGDVPAYVIQVVNIKFGEARKKLVTPKN